MKRNEQRHQLFPCTKCGIEKRKRDYLIEGFARKICKVCEQGLKPRKREKKAIDLADLKKGKVASKYFQDREDN